MSHHESDIRTALETSPAVREAVAAMLAAMGEAWWVSDDEENDTLSIDFSNHKQVTDCKERIAAASKAVDQWIMESRDDDMDANGQTVTVWSAEKEWPTGSRFTVKGTKEAAMKWAEAQVDSFTKPIQWESLNLNETYFCAPITDDIHDERTGTLRVAAHQVTLPATQQPPVAAPPADSEDRQLATIARRIAERIELYNLPISKDAHFSFIHGSTRYVGDLHAPHPAPLMESLRQLALWKAGQQVAEAGEAAPVDALTEAQQSIAELEAQVGKLQQAAEMSNNLWLDEKRRYESLYRTHIQLQHEHEELENLVIHSLGASPADWGRSQADIESLIDQNIELMSPDNRETRNDWSDTELGANTITDGIFRLKERIAELEAEVARLQGSGAELQRENTDNLDELRLRHAKGLEDGGYWKLSADEYKALYAAGERDFRRADLRGTNLSGANLSEANLWRANLSRANLSWATLWMADLSGANLSGATLSEATLSGANLSWANLSEANLSWATLSGANLSWATLSGANLSEANLSGANLSGANLSEANLSRVNLSGANLLNAPGIYSAFGVGMSSRTDTLYGGVVLQDGSIVLRFWAGCKECVTAEFLRERVKKEHAGTPREAQYMTAIQFIETCFESDMQAKRWDYLLDWSPVTEATDGA